VSSIDETSAAVKSIMPLDAPAARLPPQVPQRAGDYTIQLSASVPPPTPPPEYGYLSSLLRRCEPLPAPGTAATTGSGVLPPTPTMPEGPVTTQMMEGGGGSGSGGNCGGQGSAPMLGIPSPFLLQIGLEQALGM